MKHTVNNGQTTNGDLGEARLVLRIDGGSTSTVQFSR